MPARVLARASGCRYRAEGDAAATVDESGSVGDEKAGVSVAIEAKDLA